MLLNDILQLVVLLDNYTTYVIIYDRVFLVYSGRTSYYVKCV